jgi:hypothetical protein
MLTRSLKKGNILLDRIFVMYLYITLQQAIGLKSLIAEGLTFLGTKERSSIHFSNKTRGKETLLAAITS